MPQHVHVVHDSPVPVERLFAHLAEHEHLAQVFGAKVERVRDGDTDRNGVGSVRRLRVAPGVPPFEETVTEFVPGERIVYRITKGSPLDDHEGVMAFTARPDGGSRLDYRIRLGAKVPGLAWVVRQVLTLRVRQGLERVDRAA